jgi:hypothetical protein
LGVTSVSAGAGKTRPLILADSTLASANAVASAG